MVFHRESALASTAVIPEDLASVEGFGASAGFAVRFRLQEVFQSSLFSSIHPITITEIHFRQDTTYGIGHFKGNLSHIKFRLSTTTNAPGGLSQKFDDNFGADAETVFDGEWSFESFSTGPVNGPKDFDVKLVLQHPFKYDPTKGNLLLEYKNYSVLPQRFHTDAGGLLSGGTQMIFADGDPEAQFSQSGSSAADIVELTFSDGDAPVSPTIEQSPVDTGASEGESVTFSVLASGDKPLSYQWTHDGIPILDATNSLLRLISIKPQDAGLYAAVVSNVAGSTTSESASLTVYPQTIDFSTIPKGFSNLEGVGAWASFSNPGRLLEVYSESELPSHPILIRELRFRPDSQLNAYAGTQTISRIVVTMSTAFFSPGQISANFASNRSSDQSTVYDGPWTLSTAYLGPPQGPKNSDIRLILQKPFLYKPGLGGLLIDYQNFGSLSVRFHHDAASGLSAPPTRIAAVAADGQPNAVQGLVVGGAASIVTLGYVTPSGISPIVLSNPSDVVVSEGQGTSFSVLAQSSEQMFYQWFFQDKPITDATNSFLEFSAVKTDQSGSYFVAISNKYGIEYTAPAQLTVVPSKVDLATIPELAITTEGNGASAGFSVPMRLQEIYSRTLFPPDPITIYEIRFRPDAIFDIGAFTGVVANITFKLSTTPKEPGDISKNFEDNFGLDTMVVYNGSWTVTTLSKESGGAPKVSDIRLILEKPFKYDPSQGNLLLEYRNATGMSVRFHTDAISMKHGEVSMAFTDGQPNSLLASVTNGAADVLTLVYSKDPTKPPIIVRDPVSQVVLQGANVAFDVAVLGSTPFFFQWFKDSLPIDGATNQVLNLGSVDLSQRGFYFATISNINSAVTSLTAELIVLTNTPSSSTIPPGAAELEGVLASQVFDHPSHLQEIYSSKLFPQQPIEIRQLRYRLDSSVRYDEFPSFFSLSNIEFRLSSTRLSPGELNLKFANNAGEDEKIVYAGPWSFSIGLDSSQDGPSGFDIIVPLQTPFRFDPSLGNLLVDIRNFDRAERLFLQDATVLVGAVQRIFVDDPISDSAFQSDFAASVLQLGYSTLDLPPSIATQAKDQVLTAGDRLQLPVSVGGSRPMYYSWYRDGNQLIDQTSGDLLIANATIQDSGTYLLVVSNFFGLAQSREIKVTVKPGPTIISLGSSIAVSGSRASVPIKIARNGNEGGLAFSLVFDPRLLTFRSLDLAADWRNASLNLNRASVGSGQLGVVVAFPASDQHLPANIVLGELQFYVAPLASNSVASLNFADSPIARELVDFNAESLPAIYPGTSIPIVFHGFEGDVVPRALPDGKISLADWISVGRFVAGLDVAANGDEFQRIDCAPAETGGDGIISVIDWVQVGRYAAGLDLIQELAGPTAPPVGLLPAAPVATSSIAGEPRATLKLSPSVIQAENVISVPVIFLTATNEAALGFSVAFEPSVLELVGVDLGPDSAGGLLNVNALNSAEGRFGVALTLPSGNSFVPGENYVATLRFTVKVGNTGTTALRFTDSPIPRQSANAFARPALVDFEDATVTFNSGIPSLAFKKSAQTLDISWPFATQGYILEVSPSLAAPTWAKADLTPILVAGQWVVHVPFSSSQSYFRLHKP